jgi:cytochrome c oxidase assembly protein subunit 15
MNGVLRRYRNLQVSERTLRFWAYGTVGFFLVVISTGAAVRLTGSGLGCPDWPRCNGSFVPELDTHAWIEYGNRIISGIAIIPVLGTLISVRKLAPHRADLVRPAWWLFGGLLAQGLLGGITVKLDITWGAVMAHFLLALALLALAVLIAWRARRPPGSTPEHPVRLVIGARAIALYGAIVVVLGTLATAAGPHAGGAGTGDVVERLDVFGLRRLILTHGHMATVLGLSTIALFAYARHAGAGRGLLRAIGAAGVLMAFQGALGLVQYHSDLPAELVWLHTSAAALLWIAFLVVALEAGRPAAPTAAGSPAASTASPPSEARVPVA